MTDNSKRRGRGLVRWNGNTHPGLHEPLIDEDTFEKAQEIMRRRNEDSSLRRGNPTEFLLSGLVRCHHCGRAYVATSAHGRSGRYTYYACFTRYKYGPSKCTGDPAAQGPARSSRAHPARRPLPRRAPDPAGTRRRRPPHGLADQLDQILANESPEHAKELLRLLVKEIRVHDRRPMIPTYRIPAAVRTTPTKVDGLEPATSWVR